MMKSALHGATIVALFLSPALGQPLTDKANLKQGLEIVERKSEPETCSKSRAKVE
jgi:hypothetical protein